MYLIFTLKSERAGSSLARKACIVHTIRAIWRSHYCPMQAAPLPTAVTFKRLLDDDIRAISVIQVQTLDDLRSNAMGGTSQCSTCGRPSTTCGGHFGHIELPTKVPHPLFKDVECGVIPVPPTRLRIPNREHDAPLTSLLRRLLSSISRYKRALARSSFIAAAQSGIALAVRAYFTNSSNDGLAGLCTRLRGKQGLLRQQLMGWRVNSCARSVITPDPHLAPWEVGVPGRVARKLALKDGSRVIMNRQPSLHRGSMMGHVVRIRPNDYCFSLSPTVTPPYNADFDGDEMNLHITSVESQADAAVLIGVEENILSVANGRAMVRLVQDACLAQYLMTGMDSKQQQQQLVKLCENHGQARAALNMHKQQLDSHEHLAQRGFSIGVDDFLCQIPYADRSVYTLGNVAATICSKLPAHNRILHMVQAGSKGSSVNLAQLYSCVGMQTVCGAPAKPPLFDPQADAFIGSSFTQGLTPSEFWMHACASREGMVQTAIKTADSGYLMRRMVKCFENITVQYDDTVRTSTGHVVQFCYGGDGVDPATAAFQRPKLIEPGTPVGILCAQSLGEKLTQLTLDTFHKAGIAYRHGLLRVKTIIDASKNSDAVLRNVPKPYTHVRYRLDDVIRKWTAVSKLPPRALLEAKMRQYAAAAKYWMATPQCHKAWHVAARVRRQCCCVSDGTHVYAWKKPNGKEYGGAQWAGSVLVDNAVPVCNGPVPLCTQSYLSEPPLVAEQLGVEAARAVLIQELLPCMGGVDARHVQLLADAMTYTGKVLGATRAGIQESDAKAVLGRACFETAPNILAHAAAHHESDPLQSASSRLAIGLLPRIGAHSFQLHAKPHRTFRAPSMLHMPIAKRARFGSYME